MTNSICPSPSWRLHVPYPSSKRRFIAVTILLLQQWTAFCSSSSSSATSGIILRVRRVDGSMQRIVVPEGSQQSMTLEQLLSSISSQNEGEDNTNNKKSINPQPISSKDIRLRIGDAVIDDLSKPVSDFDLQNGSLITILAQTVTKSSVSSSSKSASLSSSSSSTTLSSSSPRWDPFPDLAKDYARALRQLKVQQRKSRGRSSYGDLAHVRANLHVVEPQPEGPLLRVYMCRKSAERFQANCITTAATATTTKKASASSSATSSRVQNRIGLLLGTIQRERKRPLQHDRKARTSLSSIPADDDYCHVAKVHAIYEPSSSSSSQEASSVSSSSTSSYDSSQLVDFDQQPTTRRVLELAQILGLSPVGWIFTYSDDYRRQQQQQETKNDVSNSKNKKNVPLDEKPPMVLAPDVVTGAQLEMAKMKFLQDDRIEGKKFVTLAMDALSGATEAFQLSDVSVQMVAEGLLLMESSSSSSGDDTGRLVKTQHAVVVDGQETQQFDAWLCLINTALLSHEGDYCSTAISNAAATSPVTKKNKLTAKTKKAIRKALESTTTTSTGDDRLLELLADFSVLVALDQLLTNDEMQRLCQLVHKWVRGQKRGTRIDNNLQLRLKSLLS